MISSTPDILYISGFGRSGSTILDILLSQEPTVFGAGELFFLFEDWLSGNRRCSCGALYADCEFWGPLAERVDISEAARLVREVESYKQIGTIGDGLLPIGLRNDYEHLQTLLFDYISEKSGCQVIIDSSKTKPEMAARPLALDRLTPLSLKMIHLVRDGRDTVQTVLEKGSNWALEGHRKKKRFQGIRTTYGWKRANDWALQYKQLLLPNRYQLIRYEDLLRDPQQTLTTIEQALGLSLVTAKRSLNDEKPLDVGHRVGGNRIRFESNLIFRQQRASLKPLSSIQDAVFGLIAGDLSRSLGYR